MADLIGGFSVRGTARVLGGVCLSWGVVDIVIPVCGIRGRLGGYVIDVARRAGHGVRVVLIGSKSPSNYPRVYGRFTGGSSEVGIVGGRGNNLIDTHGTNLTTTDNRCVTFISKSSCLGPATVRVVRTTVGGRSPSVILFRFLDVLPDSRVGDDRGFFTRCTQGTRLSRGLCPAVLCTNRFCGFNVVPDY